MLIICDGAHARKWIRTKKHLFPCNSIVLSNTKRGLFEPSASAEYSNGLISDWCLVKPDISAVLTDINDQVLVASYEPSFFDLQKTVRYIFQTRKFSQVAIVAFNDELSALMLSITLKQLDLPEDTVVSARYSVRNGCATVKESFNTREFETVVSRMFLNYYCSHYFKKIMKIRLKKEALLPDDLDFRSITPLSMFILNLVFVEPGVRSVFVGRHILDEIGVENFAETPLRSAEVQFAIDGLMKGGMILASGPQLYVADLGVKIRSVFDVIFVKKLLRLLLKPNSSSIQSIDEVMLELLKASGSTSESYKANP